MGKLSTMLLYHCMSIIKNLYQPNGYLNMDEIIHTDIPFIFIPAARGTGKTFNALASYTEHRQEIILLRRTQKEINLQNDRRGTGSSFAEVFAHLGKEFKVLKEGDIGRVYNLTDDYNAAINVALNTFASVRGSFNYQHINRVFYDEFIAEPHVRKFKNEGMSLANFYESVSRNRELSGEKPLQLVCAANAVNIANDTFMYFNLVTAAEEMISNMEEIRLIGNKLLIIPQHSPISEKKASTALYQAVDQEFTEMAINNKFVLNDFSYVHKRSLKEYTILFQAGDLFIYRHKSRSEFYITFTRGQTKEVYASSYSGLEKLRRDKYRFVGYYLDGMIRFENYRSIALFEKYFNIS